ncbi:MAG: signal peptidase II [Candidatus Dormibacteraceae bacterium]
MVAIAVFTLDRLTKNLVTSQIPYGTEVPVFGHLLGIANVHNSGAAFGLVPAGAAFFLVASIVVAIGLVIYVVRSPSNPWTLAVLGLIMGGTLGNGYDRIMFGTVTDFINFHFFPVFNAADSAITTGVVALFAGNLIRK